MTEIGESHERHFVPHQARRVVGVRQDEQLTLVVCHLCQILEVHLVRAVLMLLQRVKHHLASVALWRKAEGMVDGRLNDDLVAWFGEHVHRHAYAFHDAGYERHPFLVYCPLVLPFQPCCHRGPVGLWYHGVSEHRVLHAFAQSVDDEWRCLEIHVSHPQGQQVVTSKHLFEHAIFHGAGAPSFNRLVKIVLHIYLFDFCCKDKLKKAVLQLSLVQNSPCCCVSLSFRLHEPMRPIYIRCTIFSLPKALQEESRVNFLKKMCANTTEILM